MSGCRDPFLSADRTTAIPGTGGWYSYYFSDLKDTRFTRRKHSVRMNVGATDYAHVKERDLARVPPSAMMRGVADFALWELRLQDAHLVFGFGLAYRTDATAPLSWLHQKPSTKSVKGET